MQLNNLSLFQTNAFINNEFIPADSAKTFAVTNPFDGQEVAQVADCGVAETKRAIAAAATAFQTWKDYTATKRSKILKKWYDLQRQHADDLAKILTIEQGKPLAEAKGEVLYGASFVEWFAEEARRVYGDVIPGHQSNKRIVVLKQPVGVVGAITPWNFPSAMITRKVAPALAAGCTVVIKPAELTPLSANALAVLAKEAGFPKGVFNIIHTSHPAPVGEELCTNKTVRKISFTGSTEVGKTLLKQSAGTIKRVSLELGGNAPFIVFDDADIDKAVAGAIAAKYRNAGQTCICANRIFAQEKIYDAFVEKLAKASSLLPVGNGLEKGTVIGPLIEPKALAFVQEVVADAVTNGATVATGGGQVGAGDSLLFRPTVLKNATPNMKVFKNEIFGPVAPVFKFTTVAEVIELANDTDYGLAAYFYGNNASLIWKVAEALAYGMVGINTGAISTAVAPFGGVKESGFGREGSKYGMEDYVEVKYLCWEV